VGVNSLTVDDTGTDYVFFTAINGKISQWQSWAFYLILLAQANLAIKSLFSELCVFLRLYKSVIMSVFFAEEFFQNK
jgi:hypothetical protein